MAQTGDLIFESRSLEDNALEVEVWVVRNEDGSINHFVTNDKKEAKMRIAFEALLKHNEEAMFLMMAFATYGLEEVEE